MPNSRAEAESLIKSTIRSFRTDRGYGPSFRDLAVETNLPLGTCHEICVALAERGEVRYYPGIARSLDVA